jgi:type IV secretion system protein VirD4
MIQTLSRELFAVADENGGKLKNRVVLFCDELGTMPPFDILPLFSAGRSRRLTLVPIIQSLAQLEKNYGKEAQKSFRTTVRTPSSVASLPAARQRKRCQKRSAHARS